jgi:putative phosphoesterase
MRVFITADIHGSLSTWLTIQTLMKKSDALLIAGDLFDNRYGNPCHPDFQPEAIRHDLKTADKPVYYVYGNCDEPSFFPGHDLTLTFCANNKTVFIQHGFPRMPIPSDTDIIIQGHTHIWSLEKKTGQIFMNPGSMARPRQGPPTFGILDDTCISIQSLHTGSPLKTLNL